MINMTEQELLEKIKNSAEELKIPEGISPDKIQKNLEKEKIKKTSRKGKGIAAAALLLLCGTGSFFTYQQWKTMQDETPQIAQEEIAQGEIAQGEISQEESKEEASEEEKAVQPKKDAGNLYVVADNYGQVFDLLQTQSLQSDDRFYSTGIGAKEEMATADSSMNSASTPEYSTTNLQTEGVDESDIVKTDGSYIYSVSSDGIAITDVRGDTMKKVGKIDIKKENGEARLMEMYVDGNVLNLIVQIEHTDLQKENRDEQGVEEDTDDTTYVVEGESGMLPVTDVYYFNSSVSTEVWTYDISDRRNPQRTGIFSQDGNYKTSRRIENILYLFTENNINATSFTREEALQEENAGKWIPLVNGEAVSVDCIYVPQEGSNGLLVSSMDVNKPNYAVDNTLIMNNYVDIYVSQQAIYLYGTSYASGTADTQIGKFALNDGTIDAVGAATVEGSVQDTFAIHENEGKLRLLTTTWGDTENENKLYLLDESLKLTGTLGGIAKGEEIYAARYLEDKVYFVTYRNTDPLFVVDLSDEKNPKILSELKITGFSEYLHFWGENKLMGIGYETDPDSGAQKGIKLTMFDLSDDTQLKTLGTYVLKDYDYSPGLYDYKSVLADATENMIGFAAESYQGIYGSDKESKNYFVFSWEEGAFTEKLAEPLEGDFDISSYRGIYVGDYFYMVDAATITSYDRNDDYSMQQRLYLEAE